MLPRQSTTTHTERLDDEICVYDWQRKEVHALNATAARVWRMCDGRTSVADMAARVRAELHVDNPDDVVWRALVVFKRRHLLADGFDLAVLRATLSRRRAIAQVGLTAAMIPLVTSIVAPTALQAQSLTSQTFVFTGAVQTFVVPAGVTSINIDAYGGDGGASTGIGGRVQATVPVVAGESLDVRVGGVGGAAGVTAGGAFGGGTGGNFAGGGGGFSDVRRGTTRLVVAGGGDHGIGTGFAPGGHGGTLIGGDGTTSSVAGSGSGGGGGTQAGPGAGGAGGSPSGNAGNSGSAENGGQGGNGSGGGGGGGGGYFGGGGGGGADIVLTGRFSGGGGGGSSYTDPGATNVIHTQGANSFISGHIVISW